jgi:hypothetical protein
LLEDVGTVEPSGFGFAERAPEPSAGWIFQGLAGEVGRQSGPEGMFESGDLGAAGHVVPDPAEHAEVVGLGQFVLERLGGRHLAAVAGENTG